MTGKCKICGQSDEGTLFKNWVKPTFTNFDMLQEGSIICNNCLFWFNEQDKELAKKVGKDKPQRMRTYSHVIKSGIWTPYLKNQKQELFSQIITFPFPELCAIADSGQKHIVFRAARNKQGQKNGFIQFEEQKVFINVDEFLNLYNIVNKLYQVFNLNEIKTGCYLNFKKVKEFGFDDLYKSENKIKKYRSSSLFELTLFFAKKEEGE